MQKSRTPLTVFFKKTDAEIPVERLKTFVNKNIEYAVKIKGNTFADREHRQYLLGQACRYELELLRRGIVGEIVEIDPRLTNEQREDMLEFFTRFGGGPSSQDVLPDIEMDDEAEAPPPARVEIAPNVYEYECGCRYDLATREWLVNCPLFADGRCPQASPKREDKRVCRCVWPTHCNKCEAEYVQWWKNNVAADLLLGKRRDILFNEEGKLTTEVVKASDRLNQMAQEDDERFRAQLANFEGEGGSLALSEALTESDRRILARTAIEAQEEGSATGGLIAGCLFIVIGVMMWGAFHGV